MIWNEARVRSLLLVLWRFAAVVVLALVVSELYWPVSNQLKQQHLLDVTWAALSWLLLAAFLCRYETEQRVVLKLLFVLDVVFVSMLVGMTGGFHSPFVVLFGLLIVAAGVQAQVYLVLGVTVLACTGYLSAVYGTVWQNGAVLSQEMPLKLLLQISVFFLIGGVMGVIATRHATLAHESQVVLQAHEDLQCLHSQVMTSMQEGVLVLNHAFAVVDANAAVCRMLAKPVLPMGLDMRTLHIFPETLWDGLKQATNEPLRMEWDYQGAVYWLHADGFRQSDQGLYYWVTLTDMTELKGLERQLAEQERLAAMGRLAAMLAHEFRNPMQTISQATELMPKLPEATKERVQGIVLDEVARLNRLVTDMLDYARPQPINQSAVSMQEMVRKVLEQQHMPQVMQDVDDDTMVVDRHQWQRVLENLLHHAMAASPEGGSVCVRLGHRDDGWCLEVEDAGEKILPEMQQQMWEPFGEHRSGTGLGLAAVWHICEVNAWSLVVDSQDERTIIRVMGQHEDKEAKLGEAAVG